MNQYSEYFKARNINSEFYSDYSLPNYLLKVLPENKHTKILDIGCGYGMTMMAIKKLGFHDIKGIDLSDEALEFCKSKGLIVTKTDILNFCKANNDKFDFIIMSHVLEHIEKKEIINLLSCIRTNLLSPGGFICIMVPNAQSNTDAYWAYEDFTHHTLFTTGSLIFVLKSAGFESIKFLDPKGVEDSNFIIRLLKVFLLKIYEAKKVFWNKVTSSSYHHPSPIIFTYELKVLAK